jgi:hypothetical protein
MQEDILLQKEIMEDLEAQHPEAGVAAELVLLVAMDLVVLVVMD